MHYWASMQFGGEQAVVEILDGYIVAAVHYIMFHGQWKPYSPKWSAEGQPDPMARLQRSYA